MPTGVVINPLPPTRRCNTTMPQYEKSRSQDRWTKLLNEDFLTPDNKEALKDFYSYLQASEDIGEQRLYKYASNINTLFETFGVDFNLKEADKDQVRDLAGTIQRSDYSDWSKSDFKVVLKKFYTTLYEDEIDRPKRVKKILAADFLKSRRSKIERKNEVTALEPEEVMRMVEEAQNPRDKLIPLLFFEAGARLNEFRAVTLEDVTLNTKYAEIEFTTLKNDKGPRTLQLTRCVGLLQDYLEYHPRRGEQDAPLFVNIGPNNTGAQMSDNGIGDVLDRLKNRTDIDKRVTPHVFRHSAATHYGRKWGLNRMMYWFGWKDPDMAREYMQENEQRMREERLAEEGIDVAENGKDATARQECGRCGETAPPTASYCPSCSLALDTDTAQEAKELEESVGTIAEHRMEGVDREELKVIIAEVLEEE